MGYNFFKYIFLGAIMIFIACVDDNLVTDRNNTSLDIKVNTNEMVESRVLITDKFLPDGAEIGLTILDEFSGLPYEGIEYNNVKYTANGEGIEQLWLPERSCELLDYKAKAIAYYPYSSTATDYTAIPVEAGTTDYMYSGWVTGLNNENNNASFTMKHAMGAVRLNIKKHPTYSGTGNLTNISFKSTGIGSAAILNAETGVLSSISGLNTYISNDVDVVLTEQGCQYDYIIPTNNSAEDFAVKCIIDGKEYYKTIILNDTLRQGDMFKATFIISEFNLEIQDIDVVPWVELDEIESNFDNYSSYLSLVYNVTTTDAATTLLGSSFASYVSSYISEMIIDGVSVTPVASYTFSTTGKHEVKIRFKDETKIPCHSSYYSGGYYYYGAFVGCTALTHILRFPTQVKTIETNAFNGCTGLKSIPVFPEKLKSIGNRAFQGCTGLKAKLKIPESVTSIGESAFYGCTGLTNVTIPNSVTSISAYAFRECTGLTEVTIPNSVTGIGESAFSGCTGLTGELVLPESVINIGNNAFQGCTGLTGTLIFPNSVTSIGEYAFSGCSGFTDILIGTDVRTIGERAFGNCSKLKTITTLATIAPTIYNLTFDGIPTNGTLIVPTGCIDAYATWMENVGHCLGKKGWTIQETTE